MTIRKIKKHAAPRSAPGNLSQEDWRLLNEIRRALVTRGDFGQALGAEIARLRLLNKKVRAGRSR